jgi:hypothetical protein
MITLKNIKELLQTLRPDEIENCLNESGDYILLEAHIFNVGGFATIESHDYDEEIEEKAHSNGQLFCDKYAFQDILNELMIFEF